MLPLHTACFTNNKARVKELANQKSVNERDHYGCVAHHHAACRSSTEIVQLLIDGKADVDAVDQWGRTPLHSTAWVDPGQSIPSNQREASARAMLKVSTKGLHIKDVDGRTPFDLARKNHLVQLTEYLAAQRKLFPPLPAAAAAAATAPATPATATPQAAGPVTAAVAAVAVSTESKRKPLVDMSEHDLADVVRGVEVLAVYAEALVKNGVDGRMVRDELLDLEQDLGITNRLHRLRLERVFDELRGSKGAHHSSMGVPPPFGGTPSTSAGSDSGSGMHSPTPPASDSGASDQKSDYRVVAYSAVSFTEKADEIGKGFSSTVYKARWHGSRSTAMKVLHHIVEFLGASAEDATPRFILMTLKHLGSVELTLIRKQEFALNFTVSRGTQQRVVADDTLLNNLKVVLPMLVEVSSALLHCHEYGILHCDVAARNVLLGRDADTLHMYLCDYGMSVALPKGEESCVISRTIPIPWCAPETMKSGVWSCKTDVYSFGIFLCEILERDAPYPAFKPTEVAAKVIADPTFRPQLSGSTPAQLHELVMACLAHDPSARPTMKAVNDTLSRYTEQVQASSSLAAVYKPHKPPAAPAPAAAAASATDTGTDASAGAQTDGSPGGMGANAEGSESEAQTSSGLSVGSETVYYGTYRPM